MQQICDDTAAEHDELDGLVAGLAATDWDTPTPAEGWAIRDQISHLWFFDQRAHLALTDPEGFERDKAELIRAGLINASTDVGQATNPAELLTSWRTGRARLLDAARAADPKARIPWYGPPMGARSFITARLMETWAHGQDVFDTLGVERVPTMRLRHVAHIGVGARRFSYMIRGMELPPVDIRVELTAPDGSTWVWNDDAEARVSGPALDFCLAVTQRRHLDDTALVIEGDAATEWMSIAQAYAGAPGTGREPLTGR